MANTNKPAKAEKKIPFKIPLERGNTGDVYVALNGRPYQIKRGVKVELPESVVKILLNSEEQRLKTMELQEAIISD